MLESWIDNPKALYAVLLPWNVTVPGAEGLGFAKTKFPLLVKATGPLPEASKVALLVFMPSVMPRSVVEPLPVYCNVPPSITRFV